MGKVNLDDLAESIVGCFPQLNKLEQRLSLAPTFRFALLPDLLSGGSVPLWLARRGGPTPAYRNAVHWECLCLRERNPNRSRRSRIRCCTPRSPLGLPCSTWDGFSSLGGRKTATWNSAPRGKR